MYQGKLSLLSGKNSQSSTETHLAKHDKHYVLEKRRGRKIGGKQLNVTAYITSTQLLGTIDESIYSLSDRDRNMVLDPFGYLGLQNGTPCAIPFGTGTDHAEVEHPMHLNTLSAIDLARLPQGHVSPEVAFYLRQSRAPKTIAGYRWGWARALQICVRRRFCPLPMSEPTCCEILTELADDGLAVGSIKLVIAAINLAHRIADERTPTTTEAVRSTLRGIARTFADRKVRRMAAITPIELRLIYDRIQLEPRRMMALRDWAVFITGFAGAFRRSEIAALDTDDIELLEDRIIISIGRSKTDQEGRGATVVIQKAVAEPDLCPVRAMRAWLKVLPGPGPLFRPISGKGDHILPKRLAEATISNIVQSYVGVMNLGDLPIASHSLRAGYVTSALENETPDTVVMNHTRHRSHASLAKYYRPRNSKINMTEHSGL